MPENKKHHYVPRFYLKRFSESGKHVGLINMPSGLMVPSSNLKNQCYRDYFYGKEPAFEKSLSVLEGEFAKLFLMIDEYKSMPPPLTQEHQVLLYCLLLQEGRTKYAADALDEMYDKMIKEIFAEQWKTEKQIDLESYTIGIKDVAKFASGIHLQFYPILFDLGYKLLENTTAKDFVTSDVPVAKANPLLSFSRHGSNTGLGSKGLIIVYPSSPKCSMIFYDKDVYRVGNDSKCVIEVSSERDVEQLNTMQASACYENVYFKEDNFGADSLIKKASNYRRKAKVNVSTFVQSGAEDGKRRELLVTTGEDAKFQPSLSFLGIRKSAKAWRLRTIKSKMVPAGFVRNDELLKEQEDFMKEVKANKFKPEEFIRYLQMRNESANNSMQPAADASAD